MTGKTTFKTLVNEWLKDKEDMIKSSTHAGFTLIAENHLVPYWGKRQIKCITEADIQEYVLILYRQGRLDGTGGLAVKTIRDIILVLRLSLTYAYKKKVIPALNWDMIEYPKDTAASNVIALSKEQEQELIQSIYMHLNRKTAGILITLFTGLRIGELCGLRMCDISLSEGTITVRQTVQRIYEKKKRASKVHVGSPKTKSSERTIPFPSMLGKVIEKFWTDKPDAYFLTGTKKPTEPRVYRAFFNRFLKRQKLSKLKFHELRHTFSIRAIEIPDFDVKSLSEILGHKNVSFTINVYGRANLRQKVKCMNLLNELL